MQLILRSVGILSTHNCTITLRLNALITNTDWSRVENPSLSQLIYHSNVDQISGGLDIFNFRAQGGTGTSGRIAVVTTQELEGVTTLGNSILGGNNVFRWSRRFNCSRKVKRRPFNCFTKQPI